MLSKNVSVDKQTCKFQGHSEYKVQSGRNKRMGDGLQLEDCTDDGYTYLFCFRNEPVVQKYIDMGFCPMHAHLLWMWSQLEESWHRCTMDNLFASVMLSLAAADEEVLDIRC